MWFKRWYHEKFVNPTRNDNAKAKRKVIRIIYDSCSDDDSIACGERNNGHWFLQRQLFRPSIDSNAIASIGGDKNENNNNFDNDRTAIEATELVQMVTGKKAQVIDNSSIEQTTHITANNANGEQRQSIDIDDDNDVICRYGTDDDGGREEFQSLANISFVTDVNKYGNGEKSGLLSKPTDPRRRTFKLSIVPKINCSFCNQNRPQHTTSFDVKTCISNASISNRFQIQYDNDDGIADIDEWPPKTNFQQIDFVQRRIKELEYFISEIENRVRNDSESTSTSSSSISNCCNSITASADTNQSNTECQYCNEQSLTDWVIVSIELQSITTCENFPSDDHLSSSGKESSSSTTYAQYYTTSEVCDKHTIITVHPFQSHCTLNDRKSSSQLDYGHNCTVAGQLLCICKLLDFNNIQTGTPSIDYPHHHHHRFGTSSSDSFSCHHDQQHHQSDSGSMKFTSIPTTLARDFHSTDSFFHKDPMYPEFNYLLQEPCTSSKHHNMLTAQMIHASLSSLSSTIDSSKLVSALTPSLKCCSIESIPEYFGLNECGDIIIHVDHICEETGFGFLAGRKKKIYCDVPYGEEVCEKPKFSLKYAVKRFFKAMSDTIGKCAVVGEFKTTL